MPCDQIVLNRVDLGKASGPLLDQAMHDLGFKLLPSRGFYRRAGLEVQIEGSELRTRNLDRAGLASLANQVRVAYSKRVLGATTSALGWGIRAAGPNAYVMERR